MTYSEVLDEVCRVANWLKQQGVKKGDSVAIYMPMLLELPITMLACARIGAVHSVVFGGFSAEALADRLVNSGAKVLVTASGVMRGSKAVQLKKIVDEACNISKARVHEVCCCVHCPPYTSAASRSHHLLTEHAVIGFPIKCMLSCQHTRCSSHNTCTMYMPCCIRVRA